jgi:AcrR family transcriptional regulator
LERKIASRRRGEELEQAILDAVWEEFQEFGFAKVTVEGVAKRAGTSKPVIYRRWPTRIELMMACAANRMPSADSIPDTGTVRGDTIALLTLMRSRLRLIGQTGMLSMLAEASADPKVREVFFKQLVSNLVDRLNKAVWGRAIERGEIGPEHLTERLRLLPIDLMRSEFIVMGDATDEAVAEMVDQVVLPALRARGAQI